MIQYLKQFQQTIENNKLVFIAVILFSILFPCINFVTFFILSFKMIDMPIYQLLWIAFYAIIFNIIVLRNHTLLRIALIVINVASLFLWYFISLMGGLFGIFTSLCCSVIPFFPFWVNFFR